MRNSKFICAINVWKPDAIPEPKGLTCTQCSKAIRFAMFSTNEWFSWPLCSVVCLEARLAVDFFYLKGIVKRTLNQSIALGRLDSINFSESYIYCRTLEEAKLVESRAIIEWEEYTRSNTLDSSASANAPQKN